MWPTREQGMLSSLPPHCQICRKMSQPGFPTFSFNKGLLVKRFQSLVDIFANKKQKSKYISNEEVQQEDLFSALFINYYCDNHYYHCNYCYILIPHYRSKIYNNTNTMYLSANELQNKKISFKVLKLAAPENRELFLEKCSHFIIKQSYSTSMTTQILLLICCCYISSYQLKSSMHLS